MRKRDIVIQIIKLRSELPPLEKLIIKELSLALRTWSVKLEHWDDDVDPEVAEGIVKHVGSVRGKLLMGDVIRDVDLLLRRASTAATV